jgi:Nickel responsive protein SCO4226-like
MGMPKFVIEREIPGAGSMSQDELHKVARKSVEVLRQMGPQIQWLHSYITDNKVYCVYLAPDDATIMKHAEMVGVPANRISAVRQLLDASDGE